MATQAIFSALAELFPSALDATGPTSLNNASLPAPQSSHRPPPSIQALPALLISLVAKNQDMLKLVVIGALIETFRRLASRAWTWFLDSFFITAYFDDTDDTFSWMMVWLTKQNVWARAREVQISTATWGQTHHKGVEIPGIDGDSLAQDTGFQTKRKLAYLPAYGTTHWLRYRNTWLSVIRGKNEGRDGYSTRENIQVCLFTWNHGTLRSLLQDAKKMYRAEDEDTVSIYGADTYNDWYRTSTRKKRPLRSIVLEPEIKNLILDDAKDFLSTEKWYTDRGIPYRRGYLLHGVPGSGKTSLIHSIAGELGLDIYVVSLAKRGLDDSSLNNLICALPPRSIALMEDIDAAFHRATTARTPSPASTDTDTSNGAVVQPQPQQQDDSKGVTLSGLLNALDGVAAQEGRILFATTNRYDALDDALCRPGRMDVHVEFKCATSWQARELFRCFFPPKEDEEEEGKGRLAQRELEELAARFAEAVPDAQFSMASLQGHLMRYKDRPHEAVEAAPAWVQNEVRRRGTGAK